MRKLIRPAVSCERILGRFEAIGLLSTNPDVFLRCKRPGPTALTHSPASISRYNFRTVSRIHETVRAALLRASYSPNKPKNTAQLWLNVINFRILNLPFLPFLKS